MQNEEKIYLDQAGYEQYLKEIEKIREQIRNNGKQKSNAYEGAVGDGWHDNFEFEEAKREELKLMGLLESKLEGLNRIVIVETTDENNLIDINDYVTVETSSKGTSPSEMFFKLIASSMPNFGAEVFEISINSPLGKAVYQRKVGDNVSYTVNGNVFNVTIINKSKTLAESSKDKGTTLKRNK